METRKKRLSVLAYQSSNNEHTLDDKLKKLIELLDYSMKKNVDILLTSECYLTGYYSNKEETLSNALTLSDTRFTTFLEKIKKYNSTLILGLNRINDDKIYNTSLVIEKGEVKGSYDKIHCSYDFHTPGSTFEIFSKNGITFFD